MLWFLLIALAVLICAGVSWAVVCILAYLAALCFKWTFNLAWTTTFWLALFLIVVVFILI